MDGWANLLTGLGDPNRDKRWSARVSGFRMTDEENAMLWRYDDMAARMVTVPIEEMTREGWDCLIPGDKDTAEAVQQGMDDLQFPAKLVEALRYRRAYGGGAILIGANGGKGDLTKPLDPDSIQSIDFLTVLKPRECQGITYFADPSAPFFGESATYRIVPELASTDSAFPWMPEVHHSRVLVFQGDHVSKRQLRENFGWGDSIFVRIFEVIRDFQQNYASVAALLADFSQAAYSINGLREMLAADDGSNRLKKRLQAMDMARSIIRAVILDAGDASGMGKESFERKSTPVTGLPELLDRYATRLAAAVDMPVERLLGESTKGGLGHGGSSKIEWWEKHCGNLQQTEMKPQVRAFTELLLKAKNGPTKGKVPDVWSIRMRPLSQLTGLEEAQRRFAIAQSDQIYISTGTLTPEEVATSHWGGDEFNPEIVLDEELREGFQDAIDRKSEDTVGKPDPQEFAEQAALIPNAMDPGMQNDDFPGAKSGDAAKANPGRQPAQKKAKINGKNGKSAKTGP